MSMAPRCPQCGAPRSDAADGLCTACLLEEGLEPLDPSQPTPRLGRFGDYELIEEIARGGMGVVYKARQIGLNRVVAVKMILSGQFASAAEMQRFRAEARAAAALQHPGIVAIHEVGAHEGLLFFSMDYVEGRSLSALVRDGPLPSLQAARCVEKIARAVHYAHEQGVLHRDLKPSNVLLDTHDEPHVTDFGLAKRLSNTELETRHAELTLSGQVLGTPSFMSPEQAAGQREQMGPRSDVYSLGAILYHLLTARPPFVGADVHTILAQVINSEVITPRLLNPTAPSDLETIALKCLEKDASRRYATALALAEDLARHLNHEPIHAVPPSTIYRARKFVRRHRVGVVAAAGFALVLLGATVVSTTFGWRADHERKEALKAQAEAKAKAEEAKAVLAFFENTVLAAARPVGKHGGLGVDTTIRTAVDAAEPRVAREFADQPLVEASIRDALGTTYLDLGDYNAAIRQFERALGLSREHRGGDEGEIVDLKNNLGVAYLRAGNPAEAARHLEAAVRYYSAPGNTNMRRRIVAMDNLAAAYLKADKLDQSVRTFEDLVKLSQETLGPHDQETLVVRVNLGQAYAKAGQNEQAIAYQEETLKLARSVLGPTNELRLGMQNNLAVQYGKAGQHISAAEMLQEVLQSEQIRLPPDHPSLQVTRHNLARMYDAAGQWNEALRVFDEGLKLAQANHADDHRTFALMRAKASTLRKSGRTNEAVTLAEEALKLTRDKRRADHSETATALNNLGVAYLSAGRWTNALLVLQEALTLGKARYAPSHPELLTTMENLMAAYEKAGQANEASILRNQIDQQRAGQLSTNESNPVEAASDATVFQLEAELKDRRSKLQSDHPDLLAALLRLATAYRATNRLADAEILMEELLATQRKNLPANSRPVAESLGMLGELQLRQSKYTNAEAALRVCVDLFEKNQPGRSQTFAFQCLLGAALLGQKKYADAEKFLLPGYEGLEKRQADSPSASRAKLVKSTAESLVQLYEAWGKPDEAEQWRKKLRANTPATTPARAPP